MPDKIQPQEFASWRIKRWWHRRRFIHYRNSDDNLNVRYLNWNGDRWDWDWDWLGSDWDSYNPAALLANLFVSLLTIVWESFVLEVGHKYL